MWGRGLRAKGPYTYKNSPNPAPPTPEVLFWPGKWGCKPPARVVAGPIILAHQPEVGRGAAAHPIEEGLSPENWQKISASRGGKILLLAGGDLILTEDLEP